MLLFLVLLLVGMSYGHTITITVSGGSYTDPYYDFGSTLPATFIRGNTYKFVGIDIGTSHPFSVGVDYEQQGTLTGWSGNSVSTGIRRTEEFEFTIPTDFAAGSKLKYFCTRHSSMQKDFDISIVDAAPSAPPAQVAPSAPPAQVAPASKAKCDTHTCPSGNVLIAAASSTDCAGTTCDSGDDGVCCEAGYYFGDAEIDLCPDNGTVQIVWSGEHNIQESDDHVCLSALKQNSLPFVFPNTYAVGGHVGFLPSGTRKQIQASDISDWNSVRYFRCTQHCAGGARIKVTCNRQSPTPVCQAGSDYGSLGRVYDENAPECPNSAHPINSTTAAAFPKSDLNSDRRLCKCSSCDTLFEAMAGVDEICHDGEWRSKGSCNTYTCPEGFSAKTSLVVPNCGGAYCRYASTVQGEYGYGTEGWGQNEEELDLYKCCSYDNPDFTYVKHPRNVDGTWQNRAQGAKGCLSQKCHAKSQTLQFKHMVCNWNSGACRACDYCQVHKSAMPDLEQFELGEGCMQGCINYLYLPATSFKRQNICQHKWCDHCGFCRANRAFCSTHVCPKGYTPKDNVEKLHCEGAACGTKQDTRTCCNKPAFQAKGGCSAACERYVINPLFEDKVERFCSWSMCQECDFCKNHKGTCDEFTCPSNTTKVENPETVQCRGRHCVIEYDIMACCTSDLFAQAKGCDAQICARNYASDRFLHNRDKFCNWGACRQCNYCKTNRATCDTYTCPIGFEQKSNPSSIACEGNTCETHEDTLSCCTPPTLSGDSNCWTDKCTRYVENPRFMDKMDTMCTWDMCKGCDYCKSSHRDTCATFTCPLGFQAKCNPEHIYCEDKPCTQDDLLTCCDYPPFVDKSGCGKKCERYLTNGVHASKVDDFCDWTMCSDCDFCRIAKGVDQPLSGQCSAHVSVFKPVDKNALSNAISQCLNNAPDGSQCFACQGGGLRQAAGACGDGGNASFISDWDTSDVTDMSGLFVNFDRFNQNIASWDTSNVANMANMFQSATDFNQDISGWNTALVENMSSMFEDAVAFDIDISCWNIVNVRHFDKMFSGAIKFVIGLCWEPRLEAGFNNMFYMTGGQESGAAYIDSTCIASGCN